PSAGKAVTVRLTPPSHARGRVLRGGTPSVGARVRIVPDSKAFVAASDVRDFASPDAGTGADGRFVLPLPPVVSGVIQVVAPDGSSVRVPIPARAGSGDIELGDIALTEPRRLIVRVVGGTGCVLYAVGPAGTLGLSVVREVDTMGIVH